jgi:hypothetical protein
MIRQISKNAGGVGLTAEEYALAKKVILNDTAFDDDDWDTFKITPGGHEFSYDEYQLMRHYFLSMYRDESIEVKQAQKDQRLWEYLRKKLKPLDDNNATAKKIYQYLKQNYIP